MLEGLCLIMGGRMSDWNNIPKDISKYQGFVYMIVNDVTEQYYIGKKFFWSKKTRPPLKGRKNKRHYIVESDWKTYWGSSNNLLADIEKHGKDNFTRTMLDACETKYDCAYSELWFQMDLNVLNDAKAYNQIINVRLRKRK